MFNLKEFILSNLINGVNNNSFSKEYASILATNYLLKGILSEEDLQRFDEETTKEEEIIEDSIKEIEEEISEEENAENIENTEEIEEWYYIN